MKANFLPSSSASVRVAILGTGLYGQAMVRRVHRFRRFDLVVGSRSFSSPDTVSYADAVRGAQIVLLVVPAWTHDAVVDEISGSLTPGCVIVDVSNQPLNVGHSLPDISNAEILRKLLPTSVEVVKAFNTISAYDFDAKTPSRALPVVHMASDSERGMDVLSNFIHGIGMIPVRHGDLSAAIELENMSQRLFPAWKSKRKYSRLL